jgi:hypothetical protein
MLDNNKNYSDENRAKAQTYNINYKTMKNASIDRYALGIKYSQYFTYEKTKGNKNKIET